MTGPEHYLKAEELLAQAEGQFMDDSSDPAPRAEYASDKDWAEAMKESAEAHETAIRTAKLFAQMAAGHATLALAAATAQGALVGVSDNGQEGMSQRDMEAWDKVAGVES